MTRFLATFQGCGVESIECTHTMCTNIQNPTQYPLLSVGWPFTIVTTSITMLSQALKNTFNKMNKYRK